MMEYCNSCILPDTRPGIEIKEDGACNACHFARCKKGGIDWSRREQEFGQLVYEVKSKKRRYDCVVPVSGGKDSHWQVVTCLKYGLHTLAVSWKPPVRTVLGRKNLNNLIELGVDHIDFSINPQVERRFALLSLKQLGAPAVPMHLAMYNIALTMAEVFNIPLVVWGENAADEYGTVDGRHTGNLTSEEWLKTCSTRGTSAKDWLGKEFTRDDLTPYLRFDQSNDKTVTAKSIFLGYYFSWDPETSLKVARAHGFQVRRKGALTGYYNYADLDDALLAVHHWIKWYKFGFTRTWDNLSLEIRTGRMTRDEALEIVRGDGEQTPRESIDKFCRFTGVTTSEFWRIIDRWRNREIWKMVDGQWQIPGFIIKDYEWRKSEKEKIAGY